MENNLIGSLIRDLEEDVYCRLRPSTVSGVGVFAVRDIPKGTDPFKGFSSHGFVDIDQKLVFENPKIDPAVKELVNDIYAVSDGKLSMWEGGLNGLDIGFFVNHSKNPNLAAEEGGAVFIAMRDIKKGEELFADYRGYLDNMCTDESAA